MLNVEIYWASSFNLDFHISVVGFCQQGCVPELQPDW